MSGDLKKKSITRFESSDERSQDIEKQIASKETYHNNFVCKTGKGVQLKSKTSREFLEVFRLASRQQAHRNKQHLHAIQKRDSQKAKRPQHLLASNQD